MFCAVIVAAGSSRRAGFDKLAAPLAGVPVLRRSVDAFVAAGAAAVVVVCPQSRWEETGLAAATFPVPVSRVDGGAERQDSVAAGLAALPGGTRMVAVHDGARPLITPEGIRACLAAAGECGAAACAHPVVDTLKRADAQGLSLPEKVSRDCLWGMETPQIFRLELLQRAYVQVKEQGLVVTDEVSAVEALGIPTRLVQGSVNMKITLPGDLELAELIWKHRA
ncbi:MAG: 2-C-methyl-D-erythritol 4-phosphate cytidylyltransferase [Akkermansia sp.]|nr:2-C-methyl-D-erythritol 4-phosphate cytidylyltransferase [Akkermansia sp.]MBR6577080.1 2-C-methyl-D-erythritol 4-phosphate cytidylyltransferase [Akkermansia sp.]